MANDHYVPQFYLRNFQIPSKPNFVYSYLRHHKPRPRPISRVASADDFYKVRWDTNPNLEPNSLDFVYGLSESGTAPITNRLASGDDLHMSGEDWAHLQWFVALLAGRTVLVRERYKNTMIALKKKRITTFAARKEEFEKFVRGFDPALSPEEIEGRRQDLLNFDEHLIMSFGDDGETDYNIKGFGMMFAASVKDIIARRRWHMLETSSVRKFLTSDNPVVLLPPLGSRSGLGWGFHNSPLLIPLSPRRALLIDDSISSKAIIKVGREKMVEYVFYIVTQAHKALYASEPSLELQKMFDRTEEGALTEVHLPAGLDPSDPNTWSHS